ncbi:acylneuraminate cytidylyltransferase [Anaerobacillus alkaliphilus]|uniref:Acylneuraminate cytidylyltransferase n=2 Tax=Anaerobacillus alkaliphilus TaxID=1548597 RepID=A0A4Q0VX73_9BACI|nr:glycosyltransferase family protein [Anaerobacillus alkaliphilus]RXJ02235.1 acylneuraminate cytidylyltransferase [Anaerobacillus alkaliphilus]
MKVGAIIQARMGSTRLSGKVMKEIKGKTVLGHVIERVSQSTLIDQIVIATTDLTRDNVIEVEAKKYGANVFRGSEKDVLSRYFYAAKQNNIDVVVRITSDCPLIDPFVVDDVVSKFLEHRYNLVTNAGSDHCQRTYPRGLDTEVLSFAALEDAYHHAKEEYQREHVTPYIYEHSNNIHYVMNETDYSKYRWTLDTEEDFELINEVYKRLYNGSHDFYLEDIVQLFVKEPDLFNINAHIEQKKIN